MNVQLSHQDEDYLKQSSKLHNKELVCGRRKVLLHRIQILISSLQSNRKSKHSTRKTQHSSLLVNNDTDMPTAQNKYTGPKSVDRGDLLQLLNSSNPNTVHDFLSLSGWAIVTATQDEYMVYDEKNLHNNALLKRYLTEHQIPHLPVGSFFRGVDQGMNFLIILEEDQVKSAHRTEQHSRSNLY